jgi:hypothetical protein
LIELFKKWKGCRSVQIEPSIMWPQILWPRPITLSIVFPMKFLPRSIGPICQTKRLSLKSWSDLKLSFRSGDYQSDRRVELRARFFARGCPRFAEISPEIHDRTRR